MPEDASNLEYIIKVRVCVHRDRDVAKTKLKQVLTFYNLADHYRDMIAAMGFARESEHIREEYRRGGFKAAQAAVSTRFWRACPPSPRPLVRRCASAFSPTLRPAPRASSSPTSLRATM